MSMDPYAQCPGGCGKRMKWCSPKAYAEVEKILELVQRKQGDSSLKQLQKLIDEPGHSECFAMFLQTFRVQVLASQNKLDEADAALQQTIERFPDKGLPRELAGDFLLEVDGFAEALEEFQAALSLYPVEATDHRARTLLKIGNCHNFQGRPLAAWAAWRRALVAAPEFTAAQESIEQFVKENKLLPRSARSGLKLKSADELSVFNEERRAKWDKALAGGSELHVDDLVMAFEHLTQDDQYDAAAWYNLAVAAAWAGDNRKAIEALEHYVAIEADAEQVADAWDLGEVLRLGAGLDDFSDNVHYVADFEVRDPQSLLDKLRTCKRIVVLGGEDETPSFHWMDKEIDAQDPGIPLLGGPPRQIAQLLMLPQAIELVATTPENLREAKTQFDLTIGAAAVPVKDYQRPGSVQTLDSEPLMAMSPRGASPEERQRHLLDSVARYFEEDWIRRPLKSLSGLSPIDASQSPAFKKKLEGVVRFRERNFARFETGYDFDRLRNKLSLATSAPPERKPTSVSAYSAAQVAELKPAELSDEDLLAAYRAAASMDLEDRTLLFGQEIVGRDSMAEKTDVSKVFRRLLTARIEGKKTAGLDELLASAQRYDEKHYKGSHAGEWEGLRARWLLAEGRADEAQALLREQFDREPENLDLVASAVEGLLRGGHYRAALEFAELGLTRCEQHRRKDLKDQFREYRDAAKARAKA